ncbi:hypothetical protein MHYP_G00229830 [Metynnis hypsauchen]
MLPCRPTLLITDFALTKILQPSRDETGGAAQPYPRAHTLCASVFSLEPRFSSLGSWRECDYSLPRPLTTALSCNYSSEEVNVIVLNAFITVVQQKQTEFPPAGGVAEDGRVVFGETLRF